MADNEQSTTQAAQPAPESTASEPVAPETAAPDAEASLPAEEVSNLQDLRAGMTVRVHQIISEGENKQRTQIFQGMITATRGRTPETKTITVQKNSFGVWVEKIFPLASPLIQKIEVVKVAKVRRAKLYFVQEYARRLKEVLVKQS